MFSFCYFEVRVQYRLKGSRSLSHLLMSFCRNRVNLIFDLLTSGSMHSKRLL